MSAMCWGWGAILVILGVSGAHIANGEESQDECRMPGSWTGFWFLSGKPELIAITNQSLGWLGTCHAKQGNNKYVLHRRRDQCYQCLAIWPRHDNVIEFKAGECTDTEEADLETLCEISPDVTLNTLVRQREIDEPIECPFQGPVSFSYDKGTGLCSSPLSELTQCMTKSQLKLRYHACPDIDQTESRGWL